MDESLNDDIIIDIAPNDNECPICLDNCDPTMFIKTNCDHRFCEKCLHDWFEKEKYSCPICRSDIKL